jgi:hypothetical protein
MATTVLLLCDVCASVLLAREEDLAVIRAVENVVGLPLVALCVECANAAAKDHHDH